MLEKPEVWGADLDKHDFRALTNQSKHKSLRARSYYIKFIFGMLGTKAEMHKKHSKGKYPEIPPNPWCDHKGCCEERQSNQHVFARCRHPDIVEARHEWAAGIRKVIVNAMLPRTPDPESGKSTTTPNATQDDSVLDHRVADPLGTIPMLDDAGCIDETWTPASILPECNTTSTLSPHQTKSAI